jgi:truncated hemoglobin YjbI
MSVMQELINDNLGCYFATVMELLQYFYSHTHLEGQLHRVYQEESATLLGEHFLRLNYIWIIKHTCIQS